MQGPCFFYKGNEPRISVILNQYKVPDGVAKYLPEYGVYQLPPSQT